MTGLASVRLHPARSVVVVAALLAVLVPYIAGSALAKGMEAETVRAASDAPELTVSGNQFGRAAPLLLTVADEIRRIPEVGSVVPRIVGEVILGKDQLRCELIGLPPDHFPAWTASIFGKLPADDKAHQLAVSAPLARRLGLQLGSRLPPFYRNNRLGERVSEVVGIFEPRAPTWQSNLILTTFASAAAIFDQPGLATDFLVDCSPESAADVSRAIQERLSVPCRVVSAAELRATLPKSLRDRAGIFNVLFVLASVIAILVLVAASGVGLHERRREIGILKATGWQTDEVLLRSAAESLALSLAAAAGSFLLAWVWLRALNAYGLAPLFLAGIDETPSFSLPYHLTPVPLLLGFALSLTIILVGTLASTWLAASAAPRAAM
ncbi:MAG TPA: FtsX-like permease family protein [Urbifossiella sp.]|nr:FtsX-like permease family protein [Urbifossiella sp.]